MLMPPPPPQLGWLSWGPHSHPGHLALSGLHSQQIENLHVSTSVLHHQLLPSCVSSLLISLLLPSLCPVCFHAFKLRSRAGRWLLAEGLPGLPNAWDSIPSIAPKQTNKNSDPSVYLPTQKPPNDFPEWPRRCQGIIFLSQLPPFHLILFHHPTVVDASQHPRHPEPQGPCMCSSLHCPPTQPWVPPASSQTCLSTHGPGRLFLTFPFKRSPHCSPAVPFPDLISSISSCHHLICCHLSLMNVWPL